MNEKNTAAVYRVLDSGNGRNLEQAGPWRIIRPALCAWWAPTLPENEWRKADAEYIRDASGSGRWTGKRLPEKWIVEYSGFKLELRPTGFGHLGFFGEQYSNWKRFVDLGRKMTVSGETVNSLNLFAYSGVGSLAMAKGGFKVCHVDAAKGMIDWGRGNLEYNRDVPDAIRWIVDDVNKFCKREIRRERRYRLIALDPPSFGRGAKGEVWKIGEDLPPLLDMCRELLEPDGEAYVFLSCHSPGFSPHALSRLLLDRMGNGEIEDFEMSIPETGSGRNLPAGFCAVWKRDK